MTETVATRVARIIAGGTHALIDRAENLAPEAVMSQSVREIDQVITEVRVALGKAEAAKHLVMSQVAKLNGEHEKLTGQIEVAVSQGRDDLAGAAIGRQADIEDFLPVLQKSLNEQLERSQEFESYIMALLAKKRELEQMLNDYLASRANQSVAISQLTGSDQFSRVEDATTAFNRQISRQTGVTGGGLGAPQEAGMLKELADMQRSNRIAERLAAIKATSGQK
jgi:phage shock protein A